MLGFEPQPSDFQTDAMITEPWQVPFITNIPFLFIAKEGYNQSHSDVQNVVAS